MVQGVRRDITEGLFAPGEYGKYEGHWFGVPPGTDLLAGLDNHSITEHEDGTITVLPSILVKSHTGESWHGYLEHGIWRQV